MIRFGCDGDRLVFWHCMEPILECLIYLQLNRVKSNALTTENGGSVGLSSIIEVDVKSVVTMARGTTYK